MSNETQLPPEGHPDPAVRRAAIGEYIAGQVAQVEEARAQRVPQAYREIQRQLEAVLEAHEEGDTEEFRRALANYTWAITDGVRAIQAPMWGPTYLVDPGSLAPDHFADESISPDARVKYVEERIAKRRQELEQQYGRKL